MSDHSDIEDDKVVAEADDIAMKITNFLIEGFKTKQKRDPTNAEIEQLFEELTPERIAEMLGEVVVEEGIEGESGSANEDSGDEDALAEDSNNNDTKDEDAVLDTEVKVAGEKNIENTIDNTENDKNDNNKRISIGDCTDSQNDLKKIAVDKHASLE